jgi:hypothetical protein
MSFTDSHNMRVSSRTRVNWSKSELVERLVGITSLGQLRPYLRLGLQFDNVRN